MDSDVSGWIIEFLLQQDALDDRSLDDLLRVIPLPYNNRRLKKSLILRKIASDIGKGKISELTINFVEQIEELDIGEGTVEVSEATKTAYVTVAMHLITKSIEDNDAIEKKKYTRAAKKIWNRRIRNMEMADVCERVGLVQEDLMRLMNDLQLGVLNADACENVVANFKPGDVLEALRHYVNEAKERMGSSFLQLAFETILGDHELSKILGLDEVANPNNQMHEGASGTTDKVQKDLHTSLVNDPLPDASCLARSLKAKVDGDGNQTKRPKPNLMERNITARTIEWNDSIDAAEEGSPTRPHLPDPKNDEVSPLSLNEITKLTRRRKRKRWSVLEEDTLCSGVEKYGKGNWKLILSVYRDIFVDRNEVDLKDKWRNLTR